MKFSGPLDPATLDRISICNGALTDPARLAELQRTGLMDSGHDEAFDRLARLAAELLDVPLTIISLVGDEKQFFKAAHGLPTPFDAIREVPIGDSICRYTLYNEPIIASDARTHPLLKFHPTTEPWGIGAFVAIPMTLENGQVLGAFCAVDVKTKSWSNRDLTIMRELTASVMTEINLRLQIEELKSERDMREKFVIALSHDLRNPLSIVRMGAEVLNEEGFSDDWQSLTKLVIDNADRADSMIKDLLTASRVKSGEQVPLDLHFCDIVPVVRTTVDSLTRLYKREFEFETAGLIEGRWDADRVRRIVENLSGNAIKYGSSESKVRIALRGSPDGVELSVHNLGPTIPPTELDNLFVLFHRSESALGSSQTGWGIGLTVVRALTLEMGGKVNVSSLEGEGTTFSVFLPNKTFSPYVQ